MIRRVLMLAGLAWAVFAQTAIAQTARVISGEHADFTRLVIELPTSGDWTVGRTKMGYAFAPTSGPPPTYDLGTVWDRIPKTRLQALRTDPDSGALLLTLACPCHVFPFEYRPGTIVLDIKAGAAPPGSAFEAPFVLALPEDVAADPVASPPAYDWIGLALTTPKGSAPPQVTLPLATGSVSLDPLRDELLEQISRGAAQGVVDMELPGKPPVVPSQDGGDLAWARIAIGELPGLAIRDPEAAPGTLPGDGQTCVDDDLLAVPKWGADRKPLDLLAEARGGLYGEFDVLDRDRALKAVQAHLYLGFGAEAAQYAKLMLAEAPDEGLRDTIELYLSMARLVDGDTDPGTPFATMLGCDGPAALWAALAHDRFAQDSRVNSDAILRAFLALPAHLRRSLGPVLADRFLAAADPSSARLIRDAVERIPHIPAAEVAMLDAHADLQADRPAEARDHVEAALEDGDQGPAGLALLVEAHLRDLEPMSQEMATAVAAFARELASDPATAAAEGLPADPSRALVLALALSGQTDAAFAAMPITDDDPDSRKLVTDLWRVVTGLADDNAFLAQAVDAARLGPPDVGPEGAFGVADRLLALGFADAALVWLALSDPTDPVTRRLAATAELARGDARAAVLRLDDPRAGAATAEDIALRAHALVQLGSFSEARQAYIAAGMLEEAERLVAWEGDWTALANLTEGAAVPTPEGEIPPENAAAPNPVADSADDPWASALAILAPEADGAASDALIPTEPADGAPAEIAATGPLARGEALLAESATARAAIDALLSGVAAPTP